MNGRVYDPHLGKMMSADPTIPGPFNSQAFNRNSYVLNNPLGFTDPSGFSPAVGICGGTPRCFPAADGAGGIESDVMPNEGCTGKSATGCAGTNTNAPPRSVAGRSLIDFLNGNYASRSSESTTIEVVIGYDSNNNPITATLTGNFQDGGFTVDTGTICFICNVPGGMFMVSAQVQGRYSSSRPGWHQYPAGPNQICSAATACSSAQIHHQYLSSGTIPGRDPGAGPVQDDGIYTVHIPGTNIATGQVQVDIVTLTENLIVVVNTTLVGHPLYDGAVTRTAFRTSDGAWYSMTFGVGNNIYPGMNWVNEFVGPSIFNSMDFQMYLQNEFGGHP